MDVTDLPTSMIDVPGVAERRQATEEAMKRGAEMGIKVGQIWRAVDKRNPNPPELEVQEFTSKRRYGNGTSVFMGEYPAVKMRRLKDGGLVYALIWRFDGKVGGYEKVRETTPHTGG